MGRKKIREEKSKLLGTKHALRLLNKTAHSLTHDLDSGVAGLPPGGAAGQVLMKQSSTDYDADWAWASVFPDTLDGGDAATLVFDSIIDGEEADAVASNTLDGGDSTT